MENKQLAQLHKTNLPTALNEAINEVLNEDEAYVADELVELCETVLLELAAFGMAAYLNQPNQSRYITISYCNFSPPKAMLVQDPFTVGQPT